MYIEATWSLITALTRTLAILRVIWRIVWVFFAIKSLSLRGWHDFRIPPGTIWARWLLFFLIDLFGGLFTISLEGILIILTRISLFLPFIVSFIALGASQWIILTFLALIALLIFALLIFFPIHHVACDYLIDVKINC